MKLKISLAFIVLYLFSLALTMPANLMTGFMPKNSGVVIGPVSGTVWNGQVVEVDYRDQFQLKKLTWQIDWLALLSLQLKADFKFHNGRKVMSGQGSVSYSFSGLTVSDIDVDLTATVLPDYLNVPIPITSSGKLNLMIEKATLGSPYCAEMDGIVTWQDAIVGTPLGEVDLATPKVDLNCAQGELVASLKQKSVHLTTTADITLKEKGNYKLQGTLIGHEKLNPSILQAISMLGPKSQTGEIPFIFSGQL